MKSDDMLKQALEELMEEDLYGMPSDSPFESTHCFSEESDFTIEKLQNSITPRYTKKIYYKQILSVAACILLLCSCVLGGFQLLCGLRPTNPGSSRAVTTYSSTDDLSSSSDDDKLLRFKQLLFDFKLANKNLEMFSLEVEPYDTDTLELSRAMEEESTSETPSTITNSEDSLVFTNVESKQEETVSQYLHFSNTEQISNLAYYCIYEEDIEESNSELQGTSNTLLYTEFSDYQDEDMIQVDVCPDETIFIYVALANCITEGFEEDNYTQIYYQGILSITGTEDSNDFQVNLPFSNSVNSNEHPYVTLSISSWTESYSYNYAIALKPIDDPNAGTIFLPIASDSGVTTWFDYTPGTYLLSAESTTSSEYISGILHIYTDGETAFDLTEKHTLLK